jgi:hypothetical protein
MFLRERHERLIRSGIYFAQPLVFVFVKRMAQTHFTGTPEAQKKRVIKTELRVMNVGETIQV